MTSKSSLERSDAIHSFMRAPDKATKRRETADFVRPAPAGAGTSPSGSRTDRANLRVATLISIWFIDHLPSQSSAIAASQLGKATSLPSKLRSRGRSISTLPPWKPTLPFVFPQRCACRASPRAWRGPQITCASRSIISPRASMPEARQNNSKLAEMFERASSFSALVGIAERAGQSQKIDDDRVARPAKENQSRNLARRSKCESSILCWRVYVGRTRDLRRTGSPTSCAA